MPKQTFIFAALLIALGLGAFFMSGSRTALMPAYPGLLLAISAGLALTFANARRHFMHAAAVVALLGALAPAVKGLQPVAYADNERGAVTVEFAERDPRDAELARLRQENTHLKRAGASADHATFVDRLIDSGRLLPCFADGVRQALDIALLQDEGTVSFGEGDEARSLNLHDFLKTFLESQPPIVQFGEVAGPTGLDGTAATMTAHADRIAQWVEEERRKGRAVSFSDAPAHLFLTR